MSATATVVPGLGSIMPIGFGGKVLGGLQAISMASTPVALAAAPFAVAGVAVAAVKLRSKHAVNSGPAIPADSARPLVIGLVFKSSL